MKVALRWFGREVPAYIGLEGVYITESEALAAEAISTIESGFPILHNIIANHHN